jgi:AcrR family transcriptional regulator
MNIFRCSAKKTTPSLESVGAEGRALPDRSNPKVRQILDAGRALFLDQPYDVVSTDAIARAAKVSKATLYAYFPSKDILFASLVTDHCQMIADDIWIETGSNADVEEVLRRIARNFLEMFASTDALGLYRTIVAQVPRFPELGRLFYEAGPKILHTRIAAFLADATERGLLQVPDPQIAALQFLQLVSAEVPVTGLLGVKPMTADSMRQTAESGIALFLAGYGVRREEP